MLKVTKYLDTNCAKYQQHFLLIFGTIYYLEFNEREGNNIQTNYGIDITRTNWKFLKLIGQVLEIDLGEYYINEIGKIIGILSNILMEKGL